MRLRGFSVASRVSISSSILVMSLDSNTSFHVFIASLILSTTAHYPSRDSSPSSALIRIGRGASNPPAYSHHLIISPTDSYSRSRPHRQYKGIGPKLPSFLTSHVDHGRHYPPFPKLQSCKAPLQYGTTIRRTLSFQGRHRGDSFPRFFTLSSSKSRTFPIIITQPAPLLPYEWKWQGTRSVLAFAPLDQPLAKVGIPPYVYWKRCHLWDSRTQPHQAGEHTRGDSDGLCIFGYVYIAITLQLSSLEARQLIFSKSHVLSLKCHAVC